MKIHEKSANILVYNRLNVYMSFECAFILKVKGKGMVKAEQTHTSAHTACDFVVSTVQTRPHLKQQTPW